MRSMSNFSVAALSGCFITALSAHAALSDTTCSATSWHDSHLGSSAANGFDGYCFHTPRAMNILLYEFGLCTSSASPSNRSQCTTLFNSSAGVALELSAGARLPLTAGVSVSEGAYSHAFVVLSNQTSLEVVIQFSSPRTDDSGSSGLFCYTDGRSINSSDSIISCGGNSAAAVASTEIIALGGGAYSNTLLDYTVNMQGETVVSDLYAITNSGVLSTNANDDFALFGSQLLNQPISITPNTTNIDIGFSVTGGVTVGFVDNAAPFSRAASNSDAPVDAVWEGLRFLVSSR